jgi:ketosteroid isomerase-like protein
MDRSEMLHLFEAHREAEAARDIDAILETFIDDCFLETVALGLRSEGRDAVRAAYEMQFFSAFPDLAPRTREWRLVTTPSPSGGPCAVRAGGTG